MGKRTQGHLAPLQGMLSMQSLDRMFHGHLPPRLETVARAVLGPDGPLSALERGESPPTEAPVEARVSRPTAATRTSAQQRAGADPTAAEHRRRAEAAQAPQPTWPSSRAGGPTLLAAAPAKRPAELSRTDHRGGIGGAYYRKVESAESSAYTGVKGTGTIPSISVSLDPSGPRYHRPTSGEGAYKEGPMDRPSVYVGGHFGPAAGGTEVDAGLSYDRVYQGSQPTFTNRPNQREALDKNHQWVRSGREFKNVGTGASIPADQATGLSPNFAMRPFSRVTSGTGYKEAWTTPTPGSSNNVYFAPGERFEMSSRLVEPAEKKTVQVDGRKVELRRVETTVTSLEDAAKTCSLSAWVPTQDALGSKSFKRVNSIDQFREATEADVRRNPKLSVGDRIGNEKRTVLPTAASVTDGGWSAFEVETTHGPRALAGSRAHAVAGRDTEGRYGEVFQIGAQNDRGGEMLDIHPFRP